MIKNYSKTGKTCRVTFELPADMKADEVVLCGDFNDWSADQHVLEQRKNGRYSLTLSLDAGRSYRYRYLVDGKTWENDWNADRYEPNKFGTEDSVIDL